MAHRVFRALWLAALASNIGSLMQGVAAAWQMTALTTSPVPVALLTTMANLPLFLIGLPAGALADMVDRRWLVLITQVWMLVVATLMSAFAAASWMTPWLLLTLTFLLSLGGALSAPAWQAIVPELVPRRELATAVALNSAGFNLARAIGPAIGGLIVAASGPTAVFLLNAVSFFGVIVVIYRWRPAPRAQTLVPEQMGSALVAGLRFTRNAPPLRAVLVRTAAFIGAASAFWALLPVLATRELGLSASGYGVLLASVGLGAVGGATLLPRLRARLSMNKLVVLGSLIFAVGMSLLGLFHNLVAINIALLAMGFCWLTITSSLNVTAQTTVPAWVQARALGVYLLVFQGWLAGGSALWGLVAERFGAQQALLGAAVVIVAGLATAARWPLALGEHLDLRPSHHWPEPTLARPLAATDGPVLVTVAYQVPLTNQDAFCATMASVAVNRRRDGATQWALFYDAADPECVLETFMVASWSEHLRQHERVTVADRAVEEQALVWQQPGTQPRVSHFIAARATPDPHSSRAHT